MLEIASYAFASALAVSLVSLLGVATFSMSPTRLQKTTSLLVSLAAGAMLGNALLHLLPHSLEYANSSGQVAIHQHRHQHHQHAAPVITTKPTGEHLHDHGKAHDHDEHHHSGHANHGAHEDHDDAHHHDHEDAHHHDHEHDAVVERDHDHKEGAHEAGLAHSHDHPGLGVAALILAGLLGMLMIDFALLSRHKHNPQANNTTGYLVLLSDGLENFLDGLLIGTAYLINIPLGVATTLAVFAHEIPIEMGDFAVLLKSGFDRKKALLLNFLSGLVSLLGVAVALFAASLVPTFAVYATPLAAGAFLYIACSALLPQIRQENLGRDKYLSLLMILLGVGLMALILLIE